MENHDTGECLKELFRNVHSVAELMGQLSHLSTQLREISVNAAIASGHVESQSKIFSEIAKQIGSTASLLVQMSERSKKLTSQISTKTLTCILNTAHREKFALALANISSEANRRSVTNVCTDLAHAISKELEEAHLFLARLKPEHDSLTQVINRISSIVISLRVLANSAEHGEASFLLAIAESLQETSDKAADHSAAIWNSINHIEASLVERCNCMKGEANAA